MKRVIFIIIAFVFSAFGSSAQDVSFSQFYELPLLRNPALAGLYKGDFRATGAFRSQWQSVTTPFVSQALSVETKFGTNENSDNYLAVGVQVLNDMAGDSKLGKTSILPVLTYHKSLSQDNDTYLSLGVMAGPVQQRFDVAKLSFDDQFVNGSYSETNPTRQSFSNSNVTYIDATVGLVFSSTFSDGTKYYVGGSYFHFNKPKVAFDQSKDVILNKKIIINAGLSAATSDNDKIILYGDYFEQGGSSQFQGGFMFKHDLIQESEDETISLSGGTFLRWNDAVIPVVKLDYYNFGVGVTYDVNISKLSAAAKARGGFEITMSYRNFLNIRNSSLTKTRCPVDF
ncbi:MAG: PorP/SprF family type IX secretion system membrane protein [Ferruginibacter sp.]